jgi:endogenous inhibitor of DNA gyrase (YacG/DUF329 family)
MPGSISCPICKKPVEAGAEDFPFCSDRCRVIDLGKWASGEYKISSPIFDPDLLEELEQTQRRSGSSDSLDADTESRWKN